VFLFKIARRIFVFVLLLIIIIPAYVALNIWSTAHHATPSASDAIVILGAAQDNGIPTPILLERIKQAESAFHAGLAARIITVGAGQKGDNFTEASASYRTLMRDGIKPSRVVQIPIGQDTLASTVAYVGYMKIHHWGSVIISTDPYHCYRALAEARDLGVKASCDPVQSGPGSLHATGFKYLVRETGAYLAYKTVGQFGIHLSDQVKK